jgi:hypothetical protein
MATNRLLIATILSVSITIGCRDDIDKERYNEDAKNMVEGFYAHIAEADYESIKEMLIDAEQFYSQGGSYWFEAHVPKEILRKIKEPRPTRATSDFVIKDLEKISSFIGNIQTYQIVDGVEYDRYIYDHIGKHWFSVSTNVEYDKCKTKEFFLFTLEENTRQLKVFYYHIDYFEYK